MDKQYVKSRLDELYEDLRNAKSNDEQIRIRASIENYRKMFKVLADK